MRRQRGGWLCVNADIGRGCGPAGVPKWLPDARGEIF